MVHMSWKDDRFGDHRRNSAGSAYWPTTFSEAGEIALVVRKMTACRTSIAQWSSQFLGRGVRVSRMSRCWLRSHEAEHGKRGADI
jgi:hypothetical protein